MSFLPLTVTDIHRYYNIKRIGFSIDCYENPIGNNNTDQGDDQNPDHQAADGNTPADRIGDPRCSKCQDTLFALISVIIPQPR